MTSAAKMMKKRTKSGGELVETVRSEVTIDWTARESVRAKLGVIVKRIVRKYGYPPGEQDVATNSVLQPAVLLSDYCTEDAAT
ncbi:MAG: DUF3387 domain-containing protein [Proteobacteria bacterium]|nr:DUF3387 domain-containing protein [Pseudomonadota bacterium]